MKIIDNIIIAAKALVVTINDWIFYKKTALCRKLMAYGTTIALMKCSKTCDNENLPVAERFKEDDDGNWNGSLPTVWHLDEIVKNMNSNLDDINMTFHLNVKEWKRDEVKDLMDQFEYVHCGFSRVNKREFTLIDTVSKLNAFEKQTFFDSFRSVLKLQMQCLKNTCSN